MTSVQSEETESSTPKISRPRHTGFTYTLGCSLISPLARLAYRPRIEGAENVPHTGAVILASNHLSFIDSIAIPVTATRPVHFLAKSSYFEGTGFSGWLSKTFFRSIGAIPVRRGAGQAELDALNLERQLLDEGLVVALYPEGTRSMHGRLYKGRTGVAFLALQTGTPVVPVGLVGTDRVMPVGAKVPTLKYRVTVRFGEPLDLAPHGPATSGRARRLATDEVNSGHPCPLRAGADWRLQRGAGAGDDREDQAGAPPRAPLRPPPFRPARLRSPRGARGSSSSWR